MNELLLSGQPVPVDFFFVYPWKLKDIVNPKYNYYQNLFIFFLKPEDLQLPEEFLRSAEGYNIFDLIRVRAIWGKAFSDQITKALKCFTKEDFVFSQGNFLSGENVLTYENWQEIRKILAEENYIDLNKTNDEEDYNFANSKAAAFRKRAAETRRLVEKYKKKREPTLGFLINRFTTRSPNIDITKVWDLTFYQFKQQFEALIAIENYDLNMRALLSGNVNPKKQKIVHWTENN